MRFSILREGIVMPRCQLLMDAEETQIFSATLV